MEESKTERTKEYNRVYNRCLYDARKQLIDKYRSEFDNMLAERLLTEGIVTRRLSRDLKDSIVTAVRKEISHDSN